MKKKYNIIYSIGRDCSCAMYMQKFKLRSFSSPFDWLTNANFENRAELILNDFKDFLNKKYIKSMPKPTTFPSDGSNDYYENTKTNLYFWHDFPSTLDFESSYFQVKKKYDRRINNFYSNIKNKNKVLLIWFSQVHNTPDQIILEYCNKISAKFEKKIDFLIIEHEEGLHVTKNYMLADNVKRYFCHAYQTDKNGILQTLGNETLINPIFKQFKLIKPFYINIKNFFIKIVCLLIPIKKWRKALRKFNRK